MSASAASTVAIVGAGPIGLEAALYGARLGLDVQVYERGRIGDSVLRWGHVRLFSPWSLNRSTLGQARVGLDAPAAEVCPTGRELVCDYLRPLARCPELTGRVHERTRVVQIGRDRIGKSRPLGAERGRFPFRLLLDTPEGERVAAADVVLDCSGTYGHAGWLGNGGIPALGERAAAERIDYTLQDIEGAVRTAFEGRRVLVVGAGLSAATALDSLQRLDVPAIHWVVRSAGVQPYAPREDDPLVDRARLMRLGNALAAGADPRVSFHGASVVESVSPGAGGVAVTLRHDDTRRQLTLDRILAHVGYRPDRSIYRELQVHECYASFGPMKLAAGLLAAGVGGDCLGQQSAGAEALVNPEPGFFILGAKSYGTNPSFLIRLGLAQVREVYSLILGDPALDLYGGQPARGDRP